jgi:formate/nitrite transporter FocA (FNT family)
VRAHVIHEAIREDGEIELRRPFWALASSGFAAGLGMGFSVIAEAVLRGHLPDTPWAFLISKLGYPIGFLIVILGRQQLYTENTLTPILPLMGRRNLETFRKVLRLWWIVLSANLLGGCVMAWILAFTTVVGPEVGAAISDLASQFATLNFTTLMIRGVFSGWLIASVVWLKAAVDSGEVALVLTLTYVVGISGFPHIIAGTIDMLYALFIGEVEIGRVLGGFVLPVLIGNTLGGVSLVAGLNHAQVIAGEN